MAGPNRIRRALRGLGRRPLLENVATTAAFLGGLAMIALGVALVSLPAGIVTGGVELVAGASLYARGAGR